MSSVWILLGWDRYYPPPDGTIAVFDDEDEARSVLSDLEAMDCKEDWSRIQEKYDFMHGVDYDTYELTQHEIQ